MADFFYLFRPVLKKLGQIYDRLLAKLSSTWRILFSNFLCKFPLNYCCCTNTRFFLCYFALLVWVWAIWRARCIIHYESSQKFVITGSFFFFFWHLRLLVDTWPNLHLFLLRYISHIFACTKYGCSFFK